MSTRAYVTAIDAQKNIKLAAFCPSSAYPSNLGLEILDAIEQSKFPRFIGQLREDYPDERRTVQGISRDWYVKTASNKDDFFFDYAYEFNIEKMELNLFQRGNKALTIPFDQIPLYRYIFEHDDDLYYPLALDERTMTLKKDEYKEIRNMVKNGAGIEDFKAIVEKSAGILYVDLGRGKDGWDYNNNSFFKNIRDRRHGSLKICVNDYFSTNKYSLFIQTPFIRVPLNNRTFSSPTAAEKAIADIVRSRPDDVRATMKIFDEIEMYRKKIDQIFENDAISLVERCDLAQSARVEMVDRLHEVQKEHAILGDLNGRLEHEIKDKVFNSYRATKYRLETEEKEKASLSDQLKDAEIRAAASQGSDKGPVLADIDR